MKRKLLIAAGSIAGLLLVFLIALPFLVDAERFRPMAQTEAKKALGREVTIGKLELSIFSGGVVAKDVTVADDPAFSKEPFLRAKELKIGAELMPIIFSQKVNVKSITVVEPEIYLVRAGLGRWNFDSLGSKSTKDAKTGTAEPVTVENLRIEDGRLTITHAGTGKSRIYEDVNVSVRDFSNTSRFPFEVSAKTPGGGSLNVDGKAGPIAAGDVTKTPMESRITIKELELAATGFLDPKSGIGGLLDYDGKVESDGKKLHTEGTATVKKLKVTKGGSPANQAVTLDYATNLDLVTRKGELTQGDILVGQGKAKLTGTYDTRGDMVVVNGRFKGDNMPLDSLSGMLPAFGVVLPNGSKVQGGVASVDLQLQGPLDRLVTSGPIHVSNTKVNGFNLKSRTSGIAALAGGMPNTSDLLIQLLNSRVRVAPEGIRADGIHLVVPGVGTVTGDGTIGANNSLNFRMRAKLQGGGGLAGGLSTLSTLGQSKGELPFLIQGTTSNPLFIPDVAGAMTSTMKAPVAGAKGVFGGLFGRKKEDPNKR